MAHMIMCSDSGMSVTKSQNVSCALRRLRITSIGFHLDGMDQVRKLHGVLNEEDGNVVPDHIEVAFLGVKLNGESAHVARQVDGTSSTGYGRKAGEYRRFDARIGKEVSASHVRHRLIRLEISMRRGAARMHDALRNALMIKVRYLFAEDKILQQSGASPSCLQRVLIIGNRYALVGC